MPSVNSRVLHSRSARPVACQTCNRRKVKCSGGQPCANCQQTGRSDECTFPPRDRQIRVSQEQFETILKENDRLRLRLASVESNQPSVQLRLTDAQREQLESPLNPLLEERPWFVPLASFNYPIHINEAADGAFATRARQSLSDACINHIPRWSYAPDEQLTSLTVLGCPWPKPARARFLVKVALDTFCRQVHVVRKSTVLEALERIIADQSESDTLSTCKILLFFALGEIYSTRAASPEGVFPGLKYFARARSMAVSDVERPRIDDIEIFVLLSLYSSTLNRRHAAYIFASSSVRLGLILGLNLNVPDSQLANREEREHRVRLWWTTFMLDRRNASKLGLPASVALEDIHVDLPNEDGLSPEASVELGDTDLALCKIELAKLEERIISSIYARRKHQEPFSQRVQVIMKDLTRWVESLPDHLQIDRTGRSLVVPNHVLHLHLTFNQCVILSTRPILLHTFRKLGAATASRRSESTLAIAETCIQCARHSYRILSESWISGSFPMYDYPHTQYLFSAALILALSSLYDVSGNKKDRDNFMNACEFLEELQHAGSLAANEFCKHMESMKASMHAAELTRQDKSSRSAESSTRSDLSNPMADPTMTAGMALTDESLQAILAQPLLGLDQFDNPMAMHESGWLFGSDSWGDVWSS